MASGKVSCKLVARFLKKYTQPKCKPTCNDNNNNNKNKNKNKNNKNKKNNKNNNNNNSDTRSRDSGSCSRDHNIRSPTDCNTTQDTMLLL